ncbi:S8 family serine peptidase [Massilia antarctica]|uniref:S8 family serine peptidase n=1 Tax=Massilia antarctica TaxID=2765360 RepID=A0AA48WEL0_9BURK|nr:S8 family peptidase [Massilia antarctica]QPI50888.1 S8 family serine peptidase [Massilia antarctica]
MHPLPRFYIACTASAIAVAASLASAAQVAPGAEIASAVPAARALSIDELRAMEGSQRFDSTRLIVKFRSDATEADKEQAMRAITPTSHQRLRGGRQDRGLAKVTDLSLASESPQTRAHARAMDRYELVHLNRLWSVPSAIAQLRRNPLVEDVQPDWMLQLQDVAPSNDAAFTNLWGVQSAATSPANPFGTGAAELWQQGYACKTTQPVYVAVLDTGVRSTHEDLKDNIFTNPAEKAGDGIDNDGNGFIDDFRGWNFYSHTNNTEDDHSHGTHVAGTIAARHNNGLGVAGICGDGGVKILPVKVCSSGGSCPTSAVLEALSYVVDLKTRRGINVVAVNLSLGGMSDTANNSGIEYFQAARDANIMVAAAAGNNGSNTDVKFMWPANMDVENIIAVGNLKQDGTLSSTSNFGVTSVDIAAPGTGIYSTVISSDSAYQWKNGTSMASPHVAGAIGLYRVLHPTATVQETRNALLSSAAVEPSLNGKVAGSRRLDVSHWAWGKATSFQAQCGISLTTRAGLWIRTTAYSDSTLRTPLAQMGTALTFYNAQGGLMGSYSRKTDANGQVLWSYSLSQFPVGTQFSVNVRTDDGGSRTYTSAELACYAGH